MPQISVIVPVYRVEPYLHRCVDSILGQTFRDLEVILVDDGSPDGCPAICDAYKKLDSRVVVIHQENGGPSSARNTGLDWVFAHSRSEWLYFIDSDDWIHPRSLEAMLQGAEQTGCSVVIGRFERTEGADPAVRESALSASVWSTESFFCENTVNAIIPCGKLYRRDCFASIRYPLGTTHEDEFTTYQILFQFDTVAFITEPLYAYYQNPRGIMANGAVKSHLYIKEHGQILCAAYGERAAWFARKKNKKMTRWASNQLLACILEQYIYAARSNDAAYQITMGRVYLQALLRYPFYFGIKSHLRIVAMAFPAAYGRHIAAAFER